MNSSITLRGCVFGNTVPKGNGTVWMFLFEMELNESVKRTSLRRVAMKLFWRQFYGGLFNTAAKMRHASVTSRV